MQTLRSLINGPELIVAPVALNPMMARLAEDAGFKAAYVSGGSLGWLKCVTEANLTLHEMAQLALATAVESLDETIMCSCHHALENAIMTEKHSVPQAVLEKLRPLVGRYFVEPTVNA